MQKVIKDNVPLIVTITVVAVSTLLFSWISYTRETAKKNTKPKEEKVEMKNYTKRELSKFTGESPRTPILIAVKRKVYDVSVNGGERSYGPGGPYSLFAGRDASRLFSNFAFDEGMTEEELDTPIDPLDDLDESQKESLESYIDLFEAKYKHVGYLVEKHE
ncbi:Damage response protein 1 [Zancudomyces culisetae]|uniref:Damage response protein 1 n=1 Tax=Zancudomyces culisetae TaxID=1213189 RepID=A0A1R1PHG2_ZANCU|nr:Damage response protein 1 [Zancudomyces culisetae]|eukprot:OMH80292.1 Damage response protein 1 [Zancudomyces culisetae]